MSTLTILVIVFVAIGGLIVGIYNRLVKLNVKADEGWADIDTQLKRRYDLIPNLVETVKGYAKHENKTLEQITKYRSIAMSSENIKDRQEAENMLSSTLKSLFAVAENYPDLKANQNFMELQQTLAEIEDHIQMSRRYYNGTVRDFNTAVQVFPTNLIAGMLGFTKRDFFELANEKERENVKVSFDNSMSSSPQKEVPKK